MQLNNLHHDWLSRQKITEKVLSDFGIYSTESGDIAFPVLDSEGNFIFNKYRRSPEKNTGPKYTYDLGGKITLYGYHKAKDFNTILITEGEKDCLVAWSHNIPAVTSTGGAMSFQSEWIDLLKDKEIILCFDNDKAGGQGMAKVAKMFGIKNIKVMFLPERTGIKDISDYVLNGGNLHALIKTAINFENEEDVKEHQGDQHALWRSTHFHDEFLKVEESYRTTARKATKEGELEDAKTFPIPEIDGIKFTRKGKALCPFHSEKTPSLQYYSESNTCYCFGQCGKSFDAIDIYMKLNDCSFKEAVNKLKKL